VIVANHLGEQLLIAGAAGAGTAPLLIVFVRARLSALVRRLRREAGNEDR
jgi:hypothetical protein